MSPTGAQEASVHGRGAAALIAAIVLAAGTSSRMGRPKLLLPVGGQPLVRLSVERVLAAGLDEVLVVLGAEAAAIGAALTGLPVRTVLNPRFAEGQATSLRAGLDALAPSAEAVVIALGDQLLPDPALIGRLVDAFRRSGRPIVVPRYADGRGNPVLFAAGLFDELREVTGDRGGREVIARDATRVAEVPVAEPAPSDLDTPADYERFLH
ncbi:MAG TPA: nucleotidyltransferase family protein [Methylomirabilota bacterium]|nr:nucleotidyltransferase family protein [Methylomirabilota bacterium]